MLIQRDSVVETVGSGVRSRELAEEVVFCCGALGSTVENGVLEAGAVT